MRSALRAAGAASTPPASRRHRFEGPLGAKSLAPGETVVFAGQIPEPNVFSLIAQPQNFSDQPVMSTLKASGDFCSCGAECASGSCGATSNTSASCM